ncbi:MAG: hypothetical protein ACTSXA_12790 [Candidatus Heimdallarchaeota archaeon]
MAVNFTHTKRIAKLGTKLLIPLLVIDTAWAIVVYILFHTTFNGVIDERYDKFVIINGIITNLLFTSFFVVLTIGMLMFAIYYQKYSKIGIYASIPLISFIGIKIAFIFFRFIQLINSYSGEYMSDIFYIFEIVTASLLILGLILYDVFQTHLKKRANIGYGRSPFPYIFAFFALSYPISNILSLAGVDYTNMNVVFTVLRTLAFTASILEIIVYFDLLRRFDFMQSLDAIPEKPATTEEK